MEFKEFMESFQKAIRQSDRKFMESVYGGWFGSAGFPKDQREQFFHAIFEDLKHMVSGASGEEPECFGDFCIARFKEAGGDGIFSLVFRKKGDSWEYFNERSNFSSFSKVYAIGYQVDGEARVGVLFNGMKSPVLTDIGSSGFVSLINAALRKGENEITLLPPPSGSAKASIQISSAKEGEIIDSAQGDVLRWDGVVEEPVKLKFRAE